MINPFQLKLASIQRSNGLLNEAEFKRIRLLNGLYLQAHGYMLRVAATDGELSGKQLAVLAAISEKYDRGYFHVTTRQNVQFNWIKLLDAANAIEILSRVKLYSGHTAGNCVRQITCDPYHGIRLDELGNILPVTRTLREKFTLNPYINQLPRKVKICVWGSYEDNVLGSFNDIGIRVVGEWALVTIGGGLGKCPRVGTKLLKIRLTALASWIASFLRVYCILSGPARTKLLVSRLGKEMLLRLTVHEVRDMDVDVLVYARNKQEIAVKDDINTIDWINDEDFQRWYENHTWPHKTKGLRRVEIGCSAYFAPPGDMLAADARLLCEIAQRYSMDQIRLSLNQTIVLPFVHILYLTKVYLACRNFESHNVVCCPGLDYCTLANARSILMAQKLRLLNCGLLIRVSGCQNACSQHHVFDVGVIGINKGGKEVYQIVVGGSVAESKLCTTLVRSASIAKVPGIIAKYAALINKLKKNSFESAHKCFVRNRAFIIRKKNNKVKSIQITPLMPATPLA
ncbi:MAG: hypothetical protein ACKEQI_00070 [Candidatus Hodgkinia cicadicola]